MTSKKRISIFIIWLFQLSAIIGMTLGYHEWFLSKTPLNLLVLVGVVLLNSTLGRHSILTISWLWAAGFLIEWIGVRTGMLFGAYYYGDNLGWKLDGIPLIIGINWTLLIIICYVLAKNWSPKRWIIFLAAAIMVSLDFFIEQSAPLFGFWYWSAAQVPTQNYIAWFVLSLLLFFWYHKKPIDVSPEIAIHAYTAQLVFFLYFFLFPIG